MFYRPIPPHYLTSANHPIADATIAPAAKRLAHPRRHAHPSKFNVLGQSQGVLDIDAEIANRRFDLGMPQDYLHGAEVARSLVHKCSLGTTQRVRPVILPGQSNLGNPFRDQPGVLTSA